MSSQLQRAINIAKKTGDKIIVIDSREPENSYVLIPFDEYERDLEAVNCNCCEDEEYCGEDEEEGDEENIDFSNDYEGENDFFASTDNRLTEEERIDKINRDLSISKEENLSTEDDFDKMNFLEGNFDRIANFSQEHNGKSSHWNIPKNIKEVAEEVIEEDRHYLEEITF